MIKWKRVLFITVCFLIWYTWKTEGQTLVITPSYCLAPCDVRVELRIERDKANRWWSISYTGQEDGASGGSIDGENSEAVFPVCTNRSCLRTLRSEGTYLFVGCVHKLVDGKIKPLCVSKEVNVREPERKPERELWMPMLPVYSVKGYSIPIGIPVTQSAVLMREVKVGTLDSVWAVRGLLCCGLKNNFDTNYHPSTPPGSSEHRQMCLWPLS